MISYLFGLDKVIKSYIHFCLFCQTKFLSDKKTKIPITLYHPFQIKPNLKCIPMGDQTLKYRGGRGAEPPGGSENTVPPFVWFLSN